MGSRRDIAVEELVREASIRFRLSPAASRPLFEQALTIDPDCLEANYGLGLLALAEGDRETAVQAFECVLRVDEGQANALYHLGLLAEAEGDLRRARSVYERVLAINPEHTPAVRRRDHLESRGAR